MIMVLKSLTLTNTLSHISTIHQVFTDISNEKKLDEKLSFQLRLICEELFTNVVSYAYEDDQEHLIQIQIAITDHSVTLKIIDDGKPFDPLSHPAPDPQLTLEERGIGGWGIQFARSYMDEMHYERESNENELTLVKYIKGPNLGGNTEDDGDVN